MRGSQHWRYGVHRGVPKNTSFTHEDYNRRPEKVGGSDRSFGVVIACFVTFLALAPALHGKPIRLWLLALGAAMLLLAFARPAVLGLFNRAWSRLGQMLGRIVNPIVAGLVFFLVVTPLAMIMRMVGRQPLRLRYEPNQDTYWISRDPPGPAPETMHDQF